MGRGINVDTTKADQYAYGPVAQYKQILTTDAHPRTVYVTNTSTGFHPPHHETVYRSDDGGATWRATFFQDPRFQEYNVAPNYVTASAVSRTKGAIPLRRRDLQQRPAPIDPGLESILPHPQRRSHLVQRRHVPRPRPDARTGQRLGLHGSGGHDDLELLYRPVRGQSPLHRLHGYRLRSVPRRRQDLDLVG